MNGLPGVNLAGKTFFTANDDHAYGWELWSTDGTTSGTKLVRDINPGRENSTPEDLTTADGKLFFRAWDGVHGIELWRATP